MKREQEYFTDKELNLILGNTILEIYPNRMNVVLYHNRAISHVESFDNWQELLDVVFPDMPSFVVVKIRS